MIAEVQLNLCAGQVCGLTAEIQARIGHRRAVGNPKLFLCPRAHFQIQIRVQTEPCNQKPSERNIMFYPDGFLFHVEQGKTVSPIPNSLY